MEDPAPFNNQHRNGIRHAAGVPGAPPLLFFDQHQHAVAAQQQQAVAVPPPGAPPQAAFPGAVGAAPAIEEGQRGAQAAPQEVLTANDPHALTRFEKYQLKMQQMQQYQNLQRFGGRQNFRNLQVNENKGGDSAGSEQVEQVGVQNFDREVVAETKAAPPIAVREIGARRATTTGAGPAGAQGCATGSSSAAAATNEPAVPGFLKDTQVVISVGVGPGGSPPHGKRPDDEIVQGGSFSTTAEMTPSAENVRPSAPVLERTVLPAGGLDCGYASAHQTATVLHNGGMIGSSCPSRTTGDSSFIPPETPSGWERVQALQGYSFD
ncbi:unnamed protein product [Amoebophrya sp. A120]|nr:unnamed protein product [Amoebophrya sp. A120]|eukprot:GSA120T00014056001.1